MARLANTEVSFFKQVPIANGIVPIFRNYNEQLAAFNSKRVLTASHTLYVNASKGYFDFATNGGELDNIIQFCNYIGFFNNYFENKHFFCKISGLSKLSTNVTRVSFTVDSFQTFMFDFSMKSSMIKRQHLSEPQWQRALANPYRSDIQELTTDEGVALTSADEAPYWDSMYDVSEGQSQSGYKGILARYGGSTSRSAHDGVSGGSVTLAVDIGTYYRTSGAMSPTSAVAQYKYKYYQEKGDTAREKYWTDVFMATDNFSKGGFTNESLPLNYNGSYLNKYFCTTPGAKATSITVWEFIKKISELSDKTTINSLQNIYKIPDFVYEAIVKRGDEQYMTFNLSKLGLVNKYSEIPGYGNIEDPKLYRAPFRFIRVTTPGGDDVEHRFENFADPMNPQYCFQGDITTGNPVMYCIPRFYNGSNTAWNNAVTFGNYPTKAFYTSGFQEYINQMNRQRILGDSASAKRARDSTQKSYKDTMEGINKGGLGGLVTGAMSLVQDAYNGVNAVKGAFTGITKGPEAMFEASFNDDHERAATQQAYDSLGGKGGKHLDSTGGESYAGAYAHQRSAFVGAGEYHQGRLDNLKLMDKYDSFEFRYVTYQPYIIKGLDKVFKVFGYRCDYYNTPRVYDYIRNINEVPHFVNVDGMTFTYCQTDNCGVYGLQDWACAAVESVFNAGARFTRGFQ